MTWQFYNNAVVPSGDPMLSEVMDKKAVKELFKRFGNAWMIRYTTDFDCKTETDWWYVIKDDVFDISKLNAKRRYIVNSGRKFFDFKPISVAEHTSDIEKINIEADKAYEIKNNFTKEDIRRKINDMQNMPDSMLFGAFERETGEMCGYTWVQSVGKSIKMIELKCIPMYEKKQVNAALAGGICTHFEHKLENGCYLCDGERNVYHKTAFQDYLEKYFSFRKAYCRLHLEYRAWLRIAVTVLYPIRNIIKIAGEKSGKTVLSKIYAVLYMEECQRSCKKRGR